MRGSPLALLLFFLPLLPVWGFGADSLGLESVPAVVVVVVDPASLVLALSRMLDASRPSSRAARAVSMRRSIGRSLWRLQRSEQYLTSVDEVFADCDFREPVSGLG